MIPLYNIGCGRVLLCKEFPTRKLWVLEWFVVQSGERSGATVVVKMIAKIQPACGREGVWLRCVWP